MPRLAQPPPSDWGRAGLGWVLAALAFLVYLPSLYGPFIWDDDVMLKNNPFVQSPGGLFDIWFSTRLPDFFPLTSTSFWLEYWLWGLNSPGYHVTNVLLHAGSAVLLWRILRILAVPGAWLAALIFAIHPVNVESVAWITQRKNTLAMFCYALALLLYLRFLRESEVQGSRFKVQGSRYPHSLSTSDPRLCYALALVAFLLALLAKTSVVALPIVLLLCTWWIRASHNYPLTNSLTHSPTHSLTQRDFTRTIPFFALALALGLVTVWFQYHRAIAGEVVQANGFPARLAGAGRAVWFYLGKVLVPWPLAFIYPRWEIDPRSLLSYLPGAAILLAGAVFWRWRRTWGRGPLFGLGYFVVMLLPVLGFLDIYFLRYSLVADHWQYFAIIGPVALVVGAASLLSRQGYQSWSLRLPAVAVIVALAVLTWRQSTLYQSQVALWLDTLEKNPACWAAHNNLGLCLAAGETDPHAGGAAPLETPLAQAIGHYRESLRLKPDQFEAHINLGSAFMKMDRLEAAREQFESARKISPGTAMIYYNLGLLLDEEGKLSEAQEQYRRAIQLQPDYAEARNNLGAALQAQGNMAAAQTELEEALRLQPGQARARNNLGLALAAQGKTGEAVAQFYQLLKLNPQNPEAHNNLGKVLAEQGNLAASAAEFAEAVRQKPDYAGAHFNLGNAFLMGGKPAEALPHYSQALQVQPDFPEAHQATGVALGALGRNEEAIRHFSEALRLKPDSPEAHYQWGSLLLNQGNADEAARHFAAALQSRPGYPEAHYQLAAVLAGRKQTAEAVGHFREAVRLRPDWVEALNNLAWILATHPEANLRNGPEAVIYAVRAVELTRTNNAGALDTLAAAYAEAGRFPEAVKIAEAGVQYATRTGQTNLTAQIAGRMKLYQSQSPFRE